MRSFLAVGVCSVVALACVGDAELGGDGVAMSGSEGDGAVSAFDGGSAGGGSVDTGGGSGDNSHDGGSSAGGGSSSGGGSSTGGGSFSGGGSSSGGGVSSGGGSSTGTPSVTYFGRFSPCGSSCASFNWSGSSIAAEFSGTSVSVTLNETISDNEIFFFSVVDGVAQRFQVSAGSKSYSLASGLSATAHHTVLLFQDTEAKLGESQFLGFDFGSGGALLAPASKSYSHRVELYGDSLTVSYGNLATASSTNSCFALESAYASFGQIVANNFDAPPPTIIASSGLTLVEKSGYSIQSYYDETISGSGTLWPFASQDAPDIVIVLLGGNDAYSFPSAQISSADFISAWSTFHSNLRSRYPNAQIFGGSVSGFAMAGSSTSACANVVTAAGNINDSRFHPFCLSAYPSGQNPSEESSLCGHPTQYKDTQWGAELTTILHNAGL